MSAPTAGERLACIAARLMKGKTTVFIGTGIPMLAAALARRLYAPELLPVFEFGGIGSTLDKLPLGVGESRTFDRAFAALGLCDVMEAAQRGMVECGFLGGAQISPWGDLNTTVLGPQDRPKVRLPGSGGGNDVASLCWSTIVLMKHEKKRFCEKIDFVTSPGWLGGKDGRKKAGLPAGTGPAAVVTDLCVFDFETPDRRMRLASLNSGVSLEQVVDATGFRFTVKKPLGANPDPTSEELTLLRDVIDPAGIFRK